MENYYYNHLIWWKQIEPEQGGGIPMMNQVFGERCHLAEELAAYEPGAALAETNRR